jgi:LemA protein
MNKLGKWTIPAVLVGIVVLIAIVLGGTYNGLVASRETVNKATGDLQSAYQRRSDLIPNLVNVVKGSADFEQDTLTQVVEARSKATGVQLPDNATPEQMQAFQDAQGELSGALSRLLVTVEAYPNIKSTEAFRDLQVQLEGTENRINVARNDFNNVVRPYNQKVQTFPTNLVAGMFGFKTTPYFEAKEGAQDAPTVDFAD